MNEEKQFSQASREQVLIDVRRFAHKQIDVPENKISEQTAFRSISFTYGLSNPTV